MSNFKIFKYLVRYKQNSLFITNFITVLCIALIVVSCITLSCYYYYSDLVTDAVEEANSESMERSCATIDMFMSDCDSVLLNLCNNTEVLNFMTAKLPAKMDYKTVEMIKQLRTLLLSMVMSNDYIVSVDIYSCKNQLVVSSSNDTLLMNEHSSFAEEFMSDNDNIAVVSRDFTLGSDGGRSMSIYRKAPLISSFKQGAVVVTVDEKMFAELLTDDTLRNGSCFVVVDSDNKIIVSNNSGCIGTDYDGEHFSEKLDGFENAVVTSVNSEYNGWKYVLYTKPDKYYSDRNDKLYVTLFISLSISIIAGLLLAFWITYRTYKPIAILSDVVSSVSNDTVDTEYLINRKSDELLEIITAVFDNYKKRCEYQNELAERRIMMERAQLIALQAQINPHFLYNTLENINWSVMELTGGDNNTEHTLYKVEIHRFAKPDQNSAGFNVSVVDVNGGACASLSVPGLVADGNETVSDMYEVGFFNFTSTSNQIRVEMDQVDSDGNTISYGDNDYLNIGGVRITPVTEDYTALDNGDTKWLYPTQGEYNANATSKIISNTDDSNYSVVWRNGSDANYLDPRAIDTNTPKPDGAPDGYTYTVAQKMASVTGPTGIVYSPKLSNTDNPYYAVYVQRFAYCKSSTNGNSAKQRTVPMTLKIEGDDGIYVETIPGIGVGDSGGWKNDMYYSVMLD